jgi:hypothetical protein
MKSTVFILGAGSSIPYGYPSGSDLVELILDSLNPNYFYRFNYKNKKPGEEGYMVYPMNQSFTDHSLFTRHGFDAKLISNFEESLRNSNKDSIDSFLLERTGFYDIGKFAIANCILKCEIPTEFQFVHENWLKYLWNKINITFNRFISSNISFITFNYDRVLEFFLYTSLKYSFRLDDKEVLKALNSKQILHLHGIVGNFPWQDSDNGFDYNYNGQDVNSHYTRVATASEKIKIIYDKIDNEPIFETAFELLSNADQIYSLGFGFHHLNLERLQLSKLKNKILCSSFKMTPHESELIINQYPSQLTLDKAHHNNLDFLRNNLML